MRFLILAITLGVLCAPSDAYADVNMPWLPQRAANDCGRAVLASLLAWNAGSGQGGAKIEYERLPGPKNKMMSMLAIAEQLLKNDLTIDFESPNEGVIVGARQHRPVDNLSFFLTRLRPRFDKSDQQPILLPITRHGLQHYVVLIGTYPDGFLVYDPDPRRGGPRVRISDRELVNFMRSNDGISLAISRAGKTRELSTKTQ